MERPFHLSVLTSEKSIFDGQAVSVVLPGEEGYLGVLSDHAPLASLLKPGNILIKDATGQQKVLKSNGAGLLEISENSITVILNEVTIA